MTRLFLPSDTYEFVVNLTHFKIFLKIDISKWDLKNCNIAQYDLIGLFSHFIGVFTQIRKSLIFIIILYCHYSMSWSSTCPSLIAKSFLVIFRQKFRVFVSIFQLFGVFFFFIIFALLFRLLSSISFHRYHFDFKSFTIFTV